MNMTYKHKEEGFTIIEVVLVLAIAGLIFLMVFVALPSLQRGQRDTQRKQDLSRIEVQLNQYIASNRGAIPKSEDSVRKFVKGWLKGEEGNFTAGEEYKDPDDIRYKFEKEGPADEIGEIGYWPGNICSADSENYVTTTGGTPRSFALLIALESQTAPYCVDNRS